ncbi:MAG: GGDEF domain-containing protein [Candidatus Eremiobacteraeota bacterium]|nr:GGDEF domain-containing protein [Candidatus Eremiobacteraeota bacterium]
MKDHSWTRGAQSAPGAEDVRPTPFQWYGALSIGVLLVVVAFIAVLFGSEQGPEVKPLVPLAAGIWSLANLLTAFLLLAQFYVNGRPFFGLLAVAYGITGLLTWPYIATFPGVFHPAFSVGDGQPSIYFWSIWHAAFPVLIVIGTISDSAQGRIVSRKAIEIATAIFVVAPTVVCAAIAILTYGNRNALPHLIVNGHFQSLYRATFMPSVVALDAIACIILLIPNRLTPLKVCLALAVFSASIDASLNLTSDANSYAWDTSKVVTVFTSSVVLVMMLCDIAGLYHRLARIANTDVLTSLKNRRALEEYVAFVFPKARRMRSRLSILVIDIDHFKNYNSSFGHSGGDECLRGVARAIAGCVTRPLDMVARFGGEEFVVVFPDTPLMGTLSLAERIRSVVEHLEISHAGKALGPVTVSIGVGYAADVGTIDQETLFKAADHALYEAKAAGRNRVQLGSTEPATSLESGLLAVPSAADLGIPQE